MTACQDLVAIPKFTRDEALTAWNGTVNCGPAAIACIAGLTLDELRPHMGDFESKHYTNPGLMREVLKSLGITYRWKSYSPVLNGKAPKEEQWPHFGLCRVQWEGPWTRAGVPIRVRYRHTHWIGCQRIDGEEPNIFDVNALGYQNGWIPLSMWSSSLVPWILKHCEPQADGKWHLTHVIEVTKAAAC